MQDFMFAALLFTAYFCFACCLLHNPKASATTSNPVPVVAAANLTVTWNVQRVAPETESATTLDEELEEDAIKEPAAAIEEALIEDQEPELVSTIVEEAASVVEDAPESLPEPTIEELLQDIDLDTLQLRPARKICGKLGIQQKVNGKDAPLSWLRAQIKGRLTEKPQETAPVIMSVLKAS